jgi:F-type H+-transporting ATPase subunit b
MKNLKGIGSLIFFFIITTVSLVFGAEAEGEHHGITSTQLKNLLWFTLNFIVLCLILYKFLKKPIIDMFKARQENILKQYNELLEKKKEAEAKYVELQEKIKNLEKEAQEIYQNYVEQGIKEKERIIAEANAQAERIKQQAQLYIQHEMEKAKAILREEIAEASVKLAEEILKKNITEEDQKRMIKDFINEIKGRVLH